RIAGRLLRARAGPRIGEIDRAIGFHHDIVGKIEREALEARRQHGDGAVVLLAHDAAGRRFPGHPPALHVPPEAVGGTGILLEERYSLPWRIFPPLEVRAAE